MSGVLVFEPEVPTVRKRVICSIFSGHVNRGRVRNRMSIGNHVHCGVP